MKGNKGITLVEILISMAVFGILIIAATNLFFSGIQVWDFGEKIYSNITETDYFFRRIEDDIKNITPFGYCDVFKKNEDYIKNLFENSLYYNKFDISLKDEISVPDYNDFYEHDTNPDLKNFFIYSDSLTSWYSQNDNRELCWNYFKKDSWEKMIYNIPAFNWNDIGIWTDKGFIYYSLGTNNSYEKYRGLSVFYNFTEKSVYYFKIFVENPENIVYSKPEKIVENVSFFNIRYFDQESEEIELFEDENVYAIGGELKYFQIELEIKEEKSTFNKKKIFRLRSM